jgi:outer membrane receptor protein involved in Fe transport
VVPSANLSFAIREGRTLRMSYSRRVRRPWIWDLNPFIQQTDPLNVRLGNPDLEPAGPTRWGWT